MIAATTPTGWRTSSTSTPVGDALQRLALEQVGDRRRRLDRLDPAADLAVGVGERLAHVGADQRHQLLAAPLQLRPQRQQRPRPPLRRHRAPAGLRRPRRFDRLAHLPRAGERHQRRDLAGGGIDVVKRVDTVDRPPHPTDVIGEPHHLPRPMGRKRNSGSRFRPVGGHAGAASRATAASGRTAAIRSARRCCQRTSVTAIVIRAKSIVASTLTWTGMPRRLTPKT